MIVSGYSFDKTGPYLIFCDIENEEYKNSPVAFPSPEVYENQETYMYLGEEIEDFYNRQWRFIKVE
jgi:spermidine/putrescine transport system substrate-binding protein